MESWNFPDNWRNWNPFDLLPVQVTGGAEVEEREGLDCSSSEPATERKRQDPA